MLIHFNPADVQTVGIGLAAFLATVLAVYVFLSGRHERLGPPLLYILISGIMWSLFGFLYEIIPNLWLAREARVMSVMGIVALVISGLNFAVVYLEERVKLGQLTRTVCFVLMLAGIALGGLLVADLLGTNFIVGKLLLSTDVVLAPNAGPLMIVLIAFYCVITAIIGYLLAMRSHFGSDEIDRRQALWIFMSFTLGLALGGTRFTPWYGFDFYPLVGDIGFPLFVFVTLYTMSRYHLFSRQLAAAQALIFVIWAVSFFRILLDTSLGAAIPDITLFLAALVLGVFLMRSIIQEARAQQELARFTLEHGKAEFTTIAAHQLRTPITGIRWVFDALLGGSAGQLTDQQRELIHKGVHAIDAMRELANDLLDLDRINTGVFGYHMESGDVRDELRVCSTVMADNASDRGVSVRLNLPAEMLPASFDRGKLALVFENVLDNAIKYSSKGGFVDIVARREGSSIVIEFTDTGIGIEPEEATQIFEKFHRSEAAQRIHPDGSGLGLYIAKTIIEAHKGTIEAHSFGRGKGTTVTIRLPVQ